MNGSVKEIEAKVHGEKAEPPRVRRIPRQIEIIVAFVEPHVGAKFQRHDNHSIVRVRSGTRDFRISVYGCSYLVIWLVIPAAIELIPSLIRIRGARPVIVDRIASIAIAPRK